MCTILLAYILSVIFIPKTYYIVQLQKTLFYQLTQTTKLRLSYQLLNGVSKYKYARPCIKHYLNTGVMGRFIKIESKDWDNVLFLPTERFEKAIRNQVWQKSKDQVIRGY